MSIKKLFDSIKSSQQYSDFQTEKQAYSNVESVYNANALIDKQETFVPDVDYSNPEKFAFYGSAYLYYKAAFDRISDFYPYDGSLAEQNKFYNQLLPVEKYIFNKKYPRTTGYAIFSAGGWGTTTKTNGYGLPNTLEYITFKGGPNTGSQGSKLSDKSPAEYSSKPDRSNIYDENIYETAGLPTDYGQGTRLSNLHADFDNGVTVEFWLKTGSISTALTEKQVIFDWWNQEAASSNSYGRITIELTSSQTDLGVAQKPFVVTVMSGTTTTKNFISLGSAELHYELSDWKHYAISLANSGSNFNTKLYVNGVLNDQDSRAYDLSKDFHSYNSATTTSSYNSSANLQGWWRLNSLNALKWADSSGNGRDGSCDGGDCAAVSTSLRPHLYIVDASAQFDGSDDNVNIGTAALWDGIIGNAAGSTQKMTLGGWIYKTDTGSGLDRILDFGNTDIGLFTDDDEKVNFVVKWGTGTSFTWSSANSVIPLNTWTHVMVTYDATATTNEPVLYINGNVVAWNTSAGSRSGLAYYGILAPGDCHIGDSGGGTGPFKGNLADIAIWNTVLTIAEIKTIYSALSMPQKTTALVADLNNKNAIGRIAALQTAPVGTTAAAGAGKLNGSMDEFRFWKVERNAAQVAENYFDRVGGGTNTDITNTTLGVYFKFNEGITGVSATDSIVSDYSGRISNGVWTGYSSVSRNTGSAIVSASAAISEFEDPIIRTNHPSYTSARTELLNKGTYYDSTNNSSFLSYAPGWVIEAHEDTSNDNLKIISHIVGSYFDQVYLLSKEFPKFKHVNYPSASAEPVPFANHLPQSLGLYVPDIFVDANVQERLMNRNNTRLFENDLNETRNLIYQNLYNNLADIYKVKGTETAFKNVLRCFNIDDELVQLKVYSDNNIYEVKNNLKQVISTNKSVNFNTQSNMTAVVYQRAKATNPQSRGFISGSSGGEPNPSVAVRNEKYYGFTAEADIIFPRFFRSKEKNINRSFTDVSLFGVVQLAHPDSTAHQSGVNTTVPTTGSISKKANFQVFAIRDEQGSKNVKFKLQSTDGANPFPTLTSSVFNNVYENNRWNISVRLKPKAVGISGLVTGSTLDYDLIFRGVNSTLGTVTDSFEISSSISATSGSGFLGAHKRLYAGAQRTNITGAILNRSDVKVSNVKYWTKFIENSSLESHLHDIENSGVSGSYKNISALDASNNMVNLTNRDTLALEWNFDLLTSSNAAGTFTNQDFSSGSSVIRDNYGWLGKITGYQYDGFGQYFKASSKDCVESERVNSFKFVDPEEVVSSEMISILNDDDELLGFEQTIPNYVITAEKSFYSAISQEMLIFFAGVIDFNNLVGEPVNRYRQEYKNLTKLREAFYRRVSDVKDVEKFVSYYKWFDSAISEIFSQLVPASANFIDGVQNIVESHVLERNKYKTPFPTIESKTPDPEAGLAGFTEKNYPYDTGFSTLPRSPRRTDTRVDYWKKRAERTEFDISSGDSTVDSQRETIRKVINSTPTLTASRDSSVVSTVGGTKYNPKKYALRNFSKTLEFFTDNPNSRTFKGGTNFPADKDIDFIRAAITPGGPVNREGGKFVPQNILLSFVDDFQSIVDFKDPKKVPSKKIQRIVEVDYGRHHDDRDGYYHVKSTKAFPFGIISSSLTGGHQTEVQNALGLNLEIVNVHNDVYGPDMEKPLQGIFTEVNVGGNQHRHVALNTGADNNNNRPEAWRILLGACDSSKSGAIGLVGADYPMSPNYVAPAGANQPYPHADYPRAVHYRNKVAKAPINIDNIKITNIHNLGNYNNTYEIVNTVGAFSNPRQFVENQPTLPTNLFQNTATSSTQARTFLDIQPSRSYDSADRDRFEFVTDYSVAYLTASTNKSVIKSRFSAPGSIETSTPGYRDYRSDEFSVYNAIPFKNLSVIRPYQGPSGTLAIADATAPNAAVGIRVSDIHSEDYGLRSHLARHTARFGRDSLHVRTNPGAAYDQRPGLHKVHRNNLDTIKIASTTNTPIYSGLSLTNEKSLLYASEAVNSTLLHTASTGASTTPETLATAFTSSASTGFSWSGWIKFGEQGSSDDETIFAVGLRQGNVPLFRVVKTYGGSSYKIKLVVRTINNSDETTGIQGLTQWEWDMSGSNLTTGWNHYALTWDPITSGQLATNNVANRAAADLYFNGTKQGEALLTVGTRAYYNNNFGGGLNVRGWTSQRRAGNEFMSIGGDCQGAGNLRALTASIDEFSFWTTELSTAQVGVLYNGGTPCDIVGEISASTLPAGSNLWEWLRFETGNGNSAISLNSANLGTYAPNSNEVIGYNGEAFVPLAVTGNVLQLNNITNAALGFPLTGCVAPLVRYDIDHTFVNTAKNDNFFVNHQIPRSTKQYAWITASLVSDNGLKGIVPADFQVTASDIANSTATGYVDAYKFVSASEIGSRLAGGHRIISDDNTGTTFIPQAVHLNLNIIDDIVDNSTTLGSSTNTENYVNFANDLNSLLTKQVTPANSGLVFNQLMTKRGGQYGYPSWKQTRQADHPVLVRQRKRNQMQVMINSVPKTFSLSPVAYSQKVQEIGIQDISGNKYKIKAAHHAEYFDAKELNDLLVSPNALETITPLQSVIIAAYNSPSIKNINYVKYSEKSFPAGRNEFISHSTTRIGYANNFWHSDRDERTKLNATFNAAGAFGSNPIITGSYTRTGSFGINVSASAWPLDPQVNFLTRTAADIPAWRGASYLATAIAFRGFANAPHRNPGWAGSGSAGELQNNWSSYFIPGGLYPATSSDIRTVTRYFSADLHRATAGIPGALYARKHMLGSPQSVTAPNSIFNELAGRSGGAINLVTTSAYGRATPRSPAYGIWDASRQADICSGEAYWDAPANAGYGRKKADGGFEFISAPSVPAHDTYAKFVDSIRLQSRGKALVPEYRISRNLEEFIDYGDAFIPEKKDYFEIPGTKISSSQNQFFIDYSNSEFLKHFAEVKDMSGLSMSEIRLVCTASVKFHPYDGFFPAQRTVQLVEKFKDDYSSVLQAKIKDPIFRGSREYSGEDVLNTVPGAIRPLAQAFFAPGILYNSIKSGIAVDYPILYNRERAVIQSHYQNNAFSGAFGTTVYLGDDNRGGPFISTFHDYIIGQNNLSDINNSVNNLTSLNVGKGFTPFTNLPVDGSPLWDERIPFEAIIDPNIAANKSFADCEPHPSASLNAIARFSPTSNKKYTLMARNFFGAVADFYLKDSEFSNLTSETVYKDDFVFEEGSVYMARIKLRRSTTGSRDYSFESGSFMTSSYTQGGGTALVSRKVDTLPVLNLGEYFELPQDPIRAPDFKETFTMYSRPSAFGPPLCGAPGNVTASTSPSSIIHFQSSSTGINSGSIPAAPYTGSLYLTMSSGDMGTNTILDSFSGFNWSFTPPYYHGEAWVDLIFRPTASVSYDLERILAETATNYLRVDPGPSLRKYGVVERENSLTNHLGARGDIQDALNAGGPRQAYGYPNNVKDLSWTSLIYDPKRPIQGTFANFFNAAPYAGSSINANAMQISSSLNIFGVERVFKDTNSRATGLETSNEPVGKKWVISTKFETPMLNFNDVHGLQPVTASAGTKTTGSYGSHAAANGMWHQFGTIPNDPDTGVFMEIDDISKNWLKNHYNVRLSGSIYNNYTPDYDGALYQEGAVGSLKDLCGFKKSKTKRRVGELKDNHTVYEAVVAVPYVVESTSQNDNSAQAFVNFDGKYFFRAPPPSDLSSEAEYIKLTEMVNKYILPPQFDFVNYPKKASPISMFFFEFSHTFDKDDLSYMWQNLMPREYDKGSFQTAVCAQKLGSTLPLDEQKIINNDNLRWMIFKVKQRSQADYYDFVSAKAGQMQFDRNDDSQLQFNWPYDFCSIVEFVDVNTEVLYNNKRGETGTNTTNKYGGSITSENKLPSVLVGSSNAAPVPVVSIPGGSTPATPTQGQGATLDSSQTTNPGGDATPMGSTGMSAGTIGGGSSGGSY